MMIWTRSLLTTLACAQLSLVAMHHYQVAELGRFVRKPQPEGISRLVDRIAHSPWGLLAPLPQPAQPAETAPSLEASQPEAIPLAEVLPESTPPAAAFEAPEWLWPILEEEVRPLGLDPLLIESLIRVESGFEPQATSSVGAQGLMQLMPETAQLLGIGDPFDPRQNVAGGSRYLAWQLQDFGGDLSLALAAYNAGPAAVRRWGGVPPYPETSHYVHSVLADYQRKQQNSEIPDYRP